MITLEDIESTWGLLEGTELAPRELRIREIDELMTPLGRPLFALDDLGRRHLLIPVGLERRIQEDKRSAGIHVVVHRLIDGNQPRRFVEIACLKPHLNRLFTIVVHEVLNLLLTTDSPCPDLLCGQVLNRWRELFEKEPADRPDLETITGLFGELWHLREIVRRNPVGAACWVGPTGARHDFASARVSLEVKASLARRGRFLTINGHEQLEPPAGGMLYLAAMKLELAQDGGETLSDLLASIAVAGVDQLLLLTMLSRMGLTPDSVAKCDDVRFRVREDRLYRVDEGFPRITSHSFRGDALPSGVLTLKYEIDLSSEPPSALMASEADEVYSLLALGHQL